MYDLSRDGDLPASVRLVDNMQFQFSMALKPAVSGWKRDPKSRVQKWFATRVMGYDPDRMVACTLLFEGSRAEVAAPAGVRSTASPRRHGGMKAGAENGRRGYQLTFSIAYIRDFIMNHYVLGESFETSVPWNRILDVCEAVGALHRGGARTAQDCPDALLLQPRDPDLPDRGLRLLLLRLRLRGRRESQRRLRARSRPRSRQAILRAGGSLSHHHGIGKLRQEFLPDDHVPRGAGVEPAHQAAIDPRNVFGCRNQGVAD